MQPTTLVQALIDHAIARENCKRSGNKEWHKRHSDSIDQLATLLPSGAGIDHGTRIVELDPRRIKLSCSVHHMNDVGSYDGWTEHTIVVWPDWRGVRLTITGPDRNHIKEQLHETYTACLTAPVEFLGRRWWFVDGAPRGTEPGPSASVEAIRGE